MAQRTVRTLLLLLLPCLCALPGGSANADDLALLRSNSDATYRILVRKANGESGTGSGFVISRDGYLLTNRHVVEGSDDVHIRVRLHNGATKMLRATVVAIGVNDDLALIKVDHRFATNVVLEDPSLVEVGMATYSIGFPYSMSKSVDHGYVKQVDLAPDPTDADHAVTDRLFLYIANGPGTSGSGVYSQRTGRLIAVIQAYFILGHGQPAALKTMVTVPVTRVRAFLDAHNASYTAHPANQRSR